MLRALGQAAGHLRWEVSCPPSQPEGSGFEPEDRRNGLSCPCSADTALEPKGQEWMTFGGGDRLQMHDNICREMQYVGAVAVAVCMRMPRSTCSLCTFPVQLLPLQARMHAYALTCANKHTHAHWCRWVLFDDDTLHIKTGDDILNLSGGGDWHMAYLLLYRAITVPKA